MLVPELAVSKETQTPEAVLIIPALNEATRLGGDPYRQALENNMSTFSREFSRNTDYRMIVIDDGSNDDTSAVAERLGYETVRHDTNLGKGAAIRTGVRAVLASMLETEQVDMTIAFTDADGSYSPETMIDLIGITKGTPDIAIAKRFVDGKTKRNWRDLAHPAVQQMIKFVSATGVSDPQAGAMAFTGPAISLWSESTINGFAAPSEVLYKARKQGLQTAELPAAVTVVNESHVKPIDGLRIARDVIRIRLNK